MAGLKASPRNSVLGAISDALASAKRQGNRVNVPILGGLGDLLIGKTPEEVNEWAYGNAPMQVTGRGTGSLIPQTKRGRGEQLLDAATTLPGMIAAPLRAAPTIAKGAAGQIHRGMMGEGPLRGALSAVAPLNVIKDRGGNWIPRHIEQAIKPELRATNLEQLMNDPTIAQFLQPRAKAMEKGHKGSRFMTLSEHDELLKANPGLKSLMQDAIDDPNFNDGWIPDEHIEMAEGGLVPPPHFEDLDRFLGR